MEASRETLGETNGPLLSEKEMRDELAADVAKGKKGIQGAGCRALSTCRRQAMEVSRAGDASCEPLGETNGLLLAEIRKEMRDELAADVAKGKKGLQDTGCRALQRIKRAAEEDVQSIAEYARKAVAKAVEKEMKKRRLTMSPCDQRRTSHIAMSTGCAEGLS